MQILWWLAPACLVTGSAMVWAAWAGRPQPDRGTASAAAQARFARAIVRPAPVAARRPDARERSTGVAVRRTSEQSTRRSA